MAGRPHLTSMIADIAPMKATIEPTERSRWPATMIRSMPSAMMTMNEFCSTRLVMLTGLNSTPLVTNWKNSMITTSATSRPYSRMLFLR
ncbi:hypothetical protein D9M72_377810 [compost metagenome]